MPIQTMPTHFQPVLLILTQVHSYYTRTQEESIIPFYLSLLGRSQYFCLLTKMSAAEVKVAEAQATTAKISRRGMCVVQYTMVVMHSMYMYTRMPTIFERF